MAEVKPAVRSSGRARQAPRRQSAIEPIAPPKRTLNPKPELPIRLGPLTVTNLGKVVRDRDGFYNDRYVYPVGYRSERLYPSHIAVGEMLTYVCEVRDDGSNQPLFCVITPGPNSQCYQSHSSTGAVKPVIEQIRQVRLKATGQESKLAVSGPDFFGFYHEEVQAAIDRLPGALSVRSSDRPIGKMSKRAAEQMGIGSDDTPLPKRLALKVAKALSVTNSSVKVADTPARAKRKLIADASLASTKSKSKSKRIPHEIGRLSGPPAAYLLPALSRQKAQWIGEPLDIKEGRARYMAFRKGQETYAPGDSVFLRPENDRDPLLIARIDDMWEDVKTGDMLLTCQWFAKFTEIRQSNITVMYTPLQVEVEPLTAAGSLTGSSSPASNSNFNANSYLRLRNSPTPPSDHPLSAPVSSLSMTPSVPFRVAHLLGKKQRQTLNDPKELYLSDVVDENHVGAVVGKLFVHFTRSTTKFRADPMSSNDRHFMCRRMFVVTGLDDAIVAPVPSTLSDGPVGSGWTSSDDVLEDAEEVPSPLPCTELQSVTDLLQKGLKLPQWRVIDTTTTPIATSADESDEDTSDEHYEKAHAHLEREQRRQRLPMHEMRAMRRCARKEEKQRLAGMCLQIVPDI
eukprot:TRINITY_DN7600_c0_g1_i1.p1 TRINITY_DN7600_c0_g1~~TRINITY_DN7600_c0_g1_i1.p1  ORF type:complete len:635 (+),score=96.04 TRINITY_DN7600_c0_g1_i1:30-1907(+)